MTENSSMMIFSRPKRSLIKAGSDNVLGIPWREERELQKAMYVSLRHHTGQINQASLPHLTRARSLSSRFIETHKSPQTRLSKYHSFLDISSSMHSRSALPDKPSLGSPKIANHLSAYSTAHQPNNFGMREKLRSSSILQQQLSPQLNGLPPNQRNSNERNIEPKCNALEHSTSPPVRVRTAQSRKPCLVTKSIRNRLHSNRMKTSRLKTAYSRNAALYNGRTKVKNSRVVSCHEDVNRPRRQYKRRPSVLSSTAVTCTTLKRSKKESFSTEVKVQPALLPTNHAVLPVKSKPEKVISSVHDFVDFICYYGTPHWNDRVSQFYSNPGLYNQPNDEALLMNTVPVSDAARQQLSRTNCPSGRWFGRDQVVSAKSPNCTKSQDSRPVVVVAKKLASFHQ